MLLLRVVAEPGIELESGPIAPLRTAFLLAREISTTRKLMTGGSGFYRLQVGPRKLGQRRTCPLEPDYSRKWSH
jgi:hypothetical protein